ncbi:hypothetical protein [Alicyclobacillus dauci]|uniref:DoxX-like family protein n=1 Tax=Alicyclobacillus dauci TaxID=1475485 RepID=A0ABY6Z8Z3_9BACL|nr:hypothetical protein [Alicyclobacillus dauci]WAH39037.1 hypothetical protein NZD86_11430 [Alicyclobacillus dauci]
MRILICLAAALVTIYTGISAIEVAEVGVANQIPQLEAAGAAECIISILTLCGAVIVFWKWWVSLICFSMAMAWSVFIGIVYLDDTIWIWFGACTVLALASVWLRVRQKRIKLKWMTKSV